MRLAGILKSFEQTQKQLESFQKSNSKKISKRRAKLDAMQRDQEKAQAVSKNIAALLGEK